MGVFLGIFFNHYIERREDLDQGSEHKNSFLFTLYKFIKEHRAIRIAKNIIGFSLMLGCNLLLWNYQATKWSLIPRIIFAVLRPIFCAFGFA